MSSDRKVMGSNSDVFISPNPPSSIILPHRLYLAGPLGSPRAKFSYYGARHGNCRSRFIAELRRFGHNYFFAEKRAIAEQK